MMTKCRIKISINIGLKELLTEIHNISSGVFGLPSPLFHI